VSGSIHEGTGDTTILLLHSLALDRHIWDTHLEALHGFGDVITCDLPGHGESALLDEMTIVSMADAVSRFLAELGRQRVVVCGLSLGGCVTLALTARHPTQVSAALLCDTTAWYGPTAPSDWADRAGKARANGMASLFGFQLARWFSQGYATEHVDEVNRLLAIFERMDVERYTAVCAAMGSMDLRADVGRIEAPCSVLVGEFDLATPVAHSEDLVRRIPGASLQVLEGCGHLSPLEKRDEFTKAVKELIARR
jgi:3-oxoadipate enol-lactonase